MPDTALATISPQVFEDSLAIRAKQLRFRGVGSQFAFLDGIGIIPIQEYLFRGANIIDVADVLNIPLTVLHRWIDANNYQPEIEQASRISAEGYIYRGEKLLQEAQNKFDLDKAKAMLEHGRFMASKKDKKQYGNMQETGMPAAGVTYIFNMQGKADENASQAKSIIEGEVVKDGPFNIEMQFMPLENLGEKPKHLEKMPTTREQIKAIKDADLIKDETITEKDRWIY